MKKNHTLSMTCATVLLTMTMSEVQAGDEIVSDAEQPGGCFPKVSSVFKAIWPCMKATGEVGLDIADHYVDGEDQSIIDGVRTNTGTVADAVDDVVGENKKPKRRKNKQHKKHKNRKKRR